MHGRLVLLTLAALAGTGGALAGAQTQPQPKSPADARAVQIERRAVDLYNRATRHVRGVDAGCRTVVHAPHATYTHDAPSAELLGLLGVLGRPAGPGDQVDQTVLAHLPSAGIYVDYVRRARAADGQTFVVVAARD